MKIHSVHANNLHQFYKIPVMYLHMHVCGAILTLIFYHYVHFLSVVYQTFHCCTLPSTSVQSDDTCSLHCSNVDLPFCWQFYRPVGVPLDANEDVPVVKQLVPTSNRLFTVQPSNGTLRARESKDFIFEFFPQKVSVTI